MKDLINQRIKRIRKENNLSQKDLANSLNVSTPYIAAIEQGKQMPNTQLIMSLKEKFNISSDWLLFGIETSNYDTTFLEYVDYQISIFIDKLGGVYQRLIDIKLMLNHFGHESNKPYDSVLSPFINDFALIKNKYTYDRMGNLGEHLFKELLIDIDKSKNERVKKLKYEPFASFQDIEKIKYLKELSSNYFYFYNVFSELFKRLYSEERKKY